MAIESVIELKVNGLDELEERLKALNSIDLNPFKGMKNIEFKDPIGSGSKEIQRMSDSFKSANNGLAQFSRSLIGAGQAITSVSVGLTKNIAKLTGTMTAIALATDFFLLRQARAINTRSFESTGLGLSNPNTVRLLQGTYGMLGNTSGILGSLNIATGNPGSVAIPALASIFRRTGDPISVQQLQAMDPAERARRTLGALHRASSDPQLRRMLSNPELVSSLGLEGIAGPEQMNRLGQYSQGQFAQIQKLYDDRSHYMNMDANTRFSYQLFSAKRETGMAAVENQLLLAMKPLLEPINRVISGVFKRLSTKSDVVSNAFEKIADMIDLFADAIESGKWKEKLWDPLAKWFTHDLPPMAKKAWDEVAAAFKANFPDFVVPFQKFAERMDLISEMMLGFFNKVDIWDKRLFGSEEEKGLARDFLAGHQALGIRDWANVSRHNEGWEWSGDAGPPRPPTPEQAAWESNKGQVRENLGKGKLKNWRNWPDTFIDGYVDYFSRQYHLDPDIMKAQIFKESSGNPNAKSPKGAVGWMQLMPGTAKDLGVDPYDPLQNMEGGFRHMRKLLDLNGGNYDLALAAYNAGQGNVRKYGGVPPFRETQEYVRSIKRNAFRNANVPANGYEPGGAQWLQAPMSRAYPTLTIKSINNPQSDNNLQMQMMYGQSVSGTGN